MSANVFVKNISLIQIIPKSNRSQTYIPKKIAKIYQQLFSIPANNIAVIIIIIIIIITTTTNNNNNNNNNNKIAFQLKADPPAPRKQDTQACFLFL